MLGVDGFVENYDRLSVPEGRTRHSPDHKLRL